MANSKISLLAMSNVLKLFKIHEFALLNLSVVLLEEKTLPNCAEKL